MKTEFLNELITVIKKKFKQDLLSVVIFGSKVKGTSTATSDIDVLVVSNSLMKDWRERDKLVLDLTEDIELKFATPVHMILVSKDEISHAIESVYPLMLESQSDIWSVKLLLDGTEFSRSIYHSQQAVEKAMKASLVLTWIVITDDHWVSDRLQAFPEMPNISNLIRDSKYLERQATKSRYPLFGSAERPIWIPSREYTEHDAEDAYRKGNCSILCGIHRSFLGN